MENDDFISRDREKKIWKFNFLHESWEFKKIEKDSNLKSIAKQAHKEDMMSTLAGNEGTANCFATLLVICTIDKINTLEYDFNNFVYYSLRKFVFVTRSIGKFVFASPLTQPIDQFREILLCQSAMFVLDTMEILPNFVMELFFRDGRRFITRTPALCFAKLRIFAYALPYMSQLIESTKKQFPETAKTQNFWKVQKASIISTSFNQGFRQYLLLEKGSKSIPFARLKECVDELIYKDFVEDFNIKAFETLLID